MVPCALAPAVDWQMVQQWSIADLQEIFDGCDAHFLVVLEDDSAAESHVRGLIARDRVERSVSTRGRVRSNLGSALGQRASRLS